LTAYGWRASLVGLGAVSFVFALAFWYLLRDKDRGVNSPEQPGRPAPSKGSPFNMYTDLAKLLPHLRASPYLAWR